MDKQLQEKAKKLGTLLTNFGQKLALAESCSGGYVAQVITANSGSSKWFDCAVVSYSNQAKQKLLGVSATTLGEFGAVSRQTACAMAEGMLRVSSADICASITGIAGPSGGSDAKPVGTVHFAIAATNSKIKTYSQHFQGDRQQVRQQAVDYILDKLISYSTIIHDNGVS